MAGVVLTTTNSTTMRLCVHCPQYLNSPCSKNLSVGHTHKNGRHTIQCGLRAALQAIGQPAASMRTNFSGPAGDEHSKPEKPKGRWPTHSKLTTALQIAFAWRNQLPTSMRCNVEPHRSQIFNTMSSSARCKTPCTTI